MSTPYVKQPLRPFLNLNIHLPEGCKIISYADDLTIISTGRHCLRRAQRYLDLESEECCKTPSSLSPCAPPFPLLSPLPLPHPPRGSCDSLMSQQSPLPNPSPLDILPYTSPPSVLLSHFLNSSLTPNYHFYPYHPLFHNGSLQFSSFGVTLLFLEIDPHHFI